MTDLIIIEQPAIDTRLAVVQDLPDAAILAGQVAPSSVRMYRRDFAAYATFAGSAELAKDPITLARWRAHLAGETKLSPNTINRMLAAVKRIMAEAGQQGYISSDNAGQFADVPGVRTVAMKDRLKQHSRTKITPVQMRHLCDAPDRATLIGMRDAALLATMASSGARITEIVTLTPGQLVPRGHGWMIAIQGKNDVEPRDAPLSKEAHTLIVAWMQARPLESPYIFTAWAGRGARPTAAPLTEPAAWKLIQKYAAQAGIEHIKPHDFRRFVGTQLAKKDIRKAQKALGHKRIDNHRQALRSGRAGGGLDRRPVLAEKPLRQPNSFNPFPKFIDSPPPTPYTPSNTKPTPRRSADAWALRMSSVVLRSYSRTRGLTCQGVRRSSSGTPMDPDYIANQQALLATHRRTLAVYLRQLANLGANYAPPGVHNGIAEARAEIHSIKAWLHANGESVEDALGDVPTPEETAQAARPARDVSQTIDGGDHNIQAVDSTVTVIYQVPRPAPPRFRAAVQRIVEDYSAVFGGRNAQFAALDIFLEGDKPYALLIAPTGRGKTALLIHWLAQVQAAGRWVVVFAPISLRYQTASAEITLGALAAALADFHGERAQLQEYRQTPEDLRALVADYLRRPLPNDRRLLLVLDGLDEAIGWQLGRDLFPRMPGPHLRVVASARQLANTTRADWLDQLGWRNTQSVAFDLPGLDRAAVSDILHRLGNPLDQLATNVDLLSEIARVSQGDPITIRFLVEALQDGSLSPGRLTRLPPGLESYVKGWLAELRRGAQADPVYVLLAFCAVALGPLTNDDLQKLAPETFARLAVVQEAAASVARFIIGDGTEQSGYVFSHPRLRELFLEQVLSPDERAALQRRFVAYGEEWYSQHLRSLIAESQETPDSAVRRSSFVVRPLPAYLRQFWIAHLTEAGHWDLVRSGLTRVIPIGDRCEQPWAAARYAAEGSYAGYLADLDRLRAYTEQQHDLAISLCCTLIAGSIRSLSGNLSPELLVGLVTIGAPEGKWSSAAALEHIRQNPDAMSQAKALRALLQCNCEMTYTQALEVACAIAGEWELAEALQALAPHLPPDLWPDALAAARAITSEWARGRVLQALAPHLPPNEQPAVYAEALAAVGSIPDKRARVEALQALAPHLPPDLWPDALAAARAIADEWARGRALQALAPHLPPNEQPAVYAEALAVARAIADKREQAEALQALAPHLPPNEQPAVYAEALATARAIADKWVRRRALQALAPHLPPSEQPTVYAQLLAAVGSIPDKRARVEALQALAPHLPPSEQPTVYAEALAVARAIADKREQAEALQALAPHLPPSEQPAVYAEALATARAIADEWARVEALQALAPHLPPSEQPAVYAQVLAVASAIADEWARVEALQALAPHLPPDLWPDALAAARAITSEWVRRRALQALAPHLPPDLWPDALAAARVITSEWEQAEALQALAPHLPPSEQPTVYAEALAVACAIADKREQAEALQALAPHLPPSEQPTVNAQLLAASAIADEQKQAEALQALAPHPLPGEQPTPVAAHEIADKQVQAVVLQALCLPPSEQPAVFAQAFAVARAIRDEWARAAALRDLAPHLPSSEQPTVYAEALATACAVVDRQLRVHALRSLAPQLARNSNISSAQQLHLWHTTIHTLAARGRPRFLRDLAALTPWLAAIASPEELAEIAIAIRDVGRCWP